MRKALIFARPLSAHFSSVALAAATVVTLSSQQAWAQDEPTPPAPAPAPAAEEQEAPAPAEAEEAPAPAPAAEADPAPADEAPDAETTPSPDAGEAPPETSPVEPAAPVETAPPASTEPAPAPSGGVPTSGLAPVGDSSADFSAYPDPAADQKALEEQGEKRPDDVEPEQVFAEEWWSHTRPTLELHGNFRVRTNLYHNFHLNRIDSPESALWPRPIDDYYTDLNGVQHGPQTCTPKEAKTGTSDDPADATEGCFSPTQGGADMRFRLEPTIVISDNLRVRSQIDMLGNLVMGSTAAGNTNFPSASGGYGVSERSGYYPVSGTANSQTAPVSGVNSLQDAITVRRAWAEYDSPFGELKFGRMPDHWGLGILHNAGDDIDGDYQSTADRIAFTTGLPSMFLYAAGSWDFSSEGPTSSGFTEPGGQAYDLGQRDDVSRMNLQLYRQMDPQLEQLALKKGKVVLNGGLYLTYRYQRLANDFSGNSATCNNGAAAIDCQPGQASEGIVRRGMKLWSPDVYGELKYETFRAAFEFVTHQGKFDSLGTQPGDNDYETGETEGWRVNQWALATELDLKLMEDRLNIGFDFGYASGDGDVDSLVPGNGVQPQYGDKTIETFRFHPGYRVDMILNRHLLTRVQGSYYFKPSASYDFIRKATGLKVGGKAEAIWTRASQFMQTPGHNRDLGIELNGTVYYQSKDGVLNTREDLKGGFYSMVQYGVLFPLSGLGYQNQQTAPIAGEDLKLKPAQNVRAFLGVAF